MRRFAQILFVAVTLLAIGLAVRQNDNLPERVATHFNANGQPNGWMERNHHTTYQIGTTAFIAVLFIAIALSTPRLPDRFINLPHRDYWLAPSRRAESLAWVEGMMFWLGAALQLFLAFVFREVARANLSAKPELHLNLLWLQVSLFIMVAGLVVTLLFRFRRPPAGR